MSAEPAVTGPDALVRDLLATYGDPQACAAELICDSRPADAVAFTVVEPDLTSRDLTFGELRERSARVATGLAELGVGRGERVATLMGKSEELVVTLLAIWRLGAVHVPLFTAFAPPAIALRTRGTRVVVVDAGQREKLDAPELSGAGFTIVAVGAATDVPFASLTEREPLAEPVAVGGDGTLIELFTSGTTGSPKAVPIPLRAVASFRVYQTYGLDQRPDDVFWNAADPGWAYGLYYAIIGPMACGLPSLLLHGGFSPAVTWGVLERFGVTNFTAGPTVYRALRNALVAEGGKVPAGLVLRHCSSAGEPLTPDVVMWAEAEFGVPVRDHYGQTELGMVVANGWHPEVVATLKQGSMGRALPGWHVEVLEPEADVVAAVGERGRVAVDLQASPLMWFTGYVDAPDRTAERFSPDGRWYYTGDVAAKDADGYLTFASRDDDVILMAGYRIGPFDIESVLAEHPAVAESAVVGEPDDLRGEVVVAYVVPRGGATSGDALTAELQQLVKTKYAAHAYPREIRYVAELPKTPSGKIQRFLLRSGPTGAAAGKEG